MRFRWSRDFVFNNQTYFAFSLCMNLNVYGVQISSNGRVLNRSEPRKVLNRAEPRSRHNYHAPQNGTLCASVEAEILESTIKHTLRSVFAWSRPYYLVHDGSLPTSESKLGEARSVLATGMRWEPRVLASLSGLPLQSRSYWHLRTYNNFSSWEWSVQLCSGSDPGKLNRCVCTAYY